MLKATIIKSFDGDRLFLNDVEFPWPILDGVYWFPSGQNHPGKAVVALEILVDQATYREAPSD